jgi:hypothetical protein
MTEEIGYGVKFGICQGKAGLWYVVVNEEIVGTYSYLSKAIDAAADLFDQVDDWR